METILKILLALKADGCPEEKELTLKDWISIIEVSLTLDDNVTVEELVRKLQA